MTPTVVCPLNGQPGAERAISSAFDAASLLGSPLELFSAVEDPHMVERRRAYLEQIAKAHDPQGSPTPTTNVVVDPHAPPALANRCAGANVVTVMATSTQPIMHRGYLGSAAESLVRVATNPTVLVGPRNQSRLRDVDRVVAAIDGSKLSEQVLPAAHEWAQRLGVELWLVTALPERTHQTGQDLAAEPNYVRRIAQGIGASWEVLHGADPAHTVADWSSRSLIAVTTHGRSGLSRLTVGSVTTAITRWATGPVLVANSQSSPRT